jgi:AraC-like DNA-binding protein
MAKKKTTQSASSRQIIDARRKEGMALELRLSGVTLADIANMVGYKDASGAKYAIDRAIKRLGKPEKAEELRDMELRRLDKFFVKISEIIANKPADKVLQAIAQGLNIMERRAKLCGLDAAEKHMDVPPEEIRVAGLDPREWAKQKLRDMIGEDKQAKAEGDGGSSESE